MFSCSNSQAPGLGYVGSFANLDERSLLINSVAGLGEGGAQNALVRSAAFNELNSTTSPGTTLGPQTASLASYQNQLTGTSAFSPLTAGTLTGADSSGVSSMAYHTTEMHF